MAKKKLQLSEIKVKSFVTLVEKDNQKTSKGGYIRIHEKPNLIVDIGSTVSWTEYKTNLTIKSDVALKLFKNDKDGGADSF